LEENVEEEGWDDLLLGSDFDSGSESDDEMDET